MAYMFFVRSSPCPAPNLQPRPLLHAACAAVVHRPTAPRPVYLAPHRMPFFRLSAVRVGVQPAADRALSCTLRAPRSSTARLPPDPYTSPRTACPSFGLAVRVRVQSAAEPRHLQRHNHGLHVLRALLLVPCPQSAVEPSPARCVRRGRPPPDCPPTRITRPAPHALLSTLGSTRRRSISC
eukprot:scaffold8959_cov55-Phaeocystis_antarctica.AAC.2